MHAGDVSSRTVADKADVRAYIAGACLMLLYLAVDGLTSTWQDNLFRQYSMGIIDQVCELEAAGATMTTCHDDVSSTM